MRINDLPLIFEISRNTHFSFVIPITEVEKVYLSRRYRFRELKELTLFRC